MRLPRILPGDLLLAARYPTFSMSHLIDTQKGNSRPQWFETHRLLFSYGHLHIFVSVLAVNILLPKLSVNCESLFEHLAYVKKMPELPVRIGLESIDLLTVCPRMSLRHSESDSSMYPCLNMFAFYNQFLLQTTLNISLYPCTSSC